MRRLLLLLIFLLALTIEAQNRLPSSITMRQDRPISTVYWSADGKRILSESGENLQFWDLDAGTFEASVEYRRNDLAITSVAWSPDEAHYYVGFDSISHTNPFHYQVSLDGHLLADYNNRALWNPDSRRLLTWMYRSLPVEDNQPLRVYHAETRELIGSLSHIHGVQEAVWSSDGESVLYIAYRFNERAYYGQYVIGRWLPTETEPIEEIALPDVESYKVSWIPANTLRDTTIITSPYYGYGSPDCVAQSPSILCNIHIKAAGQDEFTVYTGTNADYPPVEPKLSPSGQWLTATNYTESGGICSQDCGSIFIWNRSDPDTPHSFQIVGEKMRGFVWSPDEESIAIWNRDFALNPCEDEERCSETLRLLNTDAELELKLPLNKTISSVQWSADSSYLLVKTNYDYRCRQDCYASLLWVDAQTGAIRFEIRDDFIGYHEWHEAENSLLVVQGRLIYLYDLAHPENPLILDGHISTPSQVIWRENELLSWGSDGTIRYWDLIGQTEPYEMGTPLWLIEEHPEESYTLYAVQQGNISEVAFNADESHLLTWSYDNGSVAVWDLSGEHEPIVLNHFPEQDYEYVFKVRWLDNSHFLTDTNNGYEIWDISPNASPYDPQRLSDETYTLNYLHQAYIAESPEHGIGLLQEIEGERREIRLEHGGANYIRFQFLPNPDWVITSGDGMTKLWDISNPEAPVLLGQRDVSISYPFSLSPDGLYMLAVRDLLEVLELPTLETAYSGNFGVFYTDSTWDSTGQRLLLRGSPSDDCENCTASVWIAYPFANRPALEFGHHGNLNNAYWIENESMIITSEESLDESLQILHIWDANTGEELQRYSFETWEIGYDWQQGKLFVWFSRDYQHFLYIYDGIGDTEPQILQNSGSIMGVRLNRDGSRLVVYGGGSGFDSLSEIRVWDFARVLVSHE